MEIRTHSDFVPLDTLDALEDAIARSEREPVVLFKHSSLCGLSARARRKLNDLAGGTPPVYEVVVQRRRELSNDIEQRFGIRHETPQVIVLHRRRPVFDASHHRVSAETVRQAVDPLTTP